MRIDSDGSFSGERGDTAFCPYGGMLSKPIFRDLPSMVKMEQIIACEDATLA